MFLSNNSTYPVGLDISDLSLKLVQLNKVRGKIKIQALGKLNLPKGVIENGEIKNKAELIKCFKKIMASPLYGKVSSEEIVACLPESKTFVKLIEVQKSPNALADIIGSEIEKHVPLALDEIYYDWQAIEESADKYSILIGAAPKDIVNQYTLTLDQTRLSPAALEIEPVALCRCLLKEETPDFKKINAGDKAKIGENHNYGIIDVGANHTCMFFYSGGTILFTVSMPISGEEISAEIAESLSLTGEQAEKAKIICGLDQNKAGGVIKEILGEMIEKLTGKISEALSFYENYFPGRGPLSRIMLCGGGAKIAGLGEIIGKKLSLEVKAADVLANLNLDKEKSSELFLERHSLDFKAAKLGAAAKKNRLSITQDSSSTYATAIGLALRGVFIDEL